MALLSTTPTVATAEDPTNPQVDISYVEPRNASYIPFYQRLQQQQVLESLRQFLAPLRLTRKLTAKTDECNGALTVPYKPEQPITICYEFVAAVEKAAPRSGRVVRIGSRQLSEEAVLVGPLVGLVLNQVAHTVLDILQVPTWGNANDAADNVAALIMLEFDDEVAWTTLIGTTWFLAQRGFASYGTGEFADSTTVPIQAQRFYNYLCMAYGSDPGKFGFLLINDDLPRGRAARCGLEYRQKLRSFIQAILPQLDQELLKQVLAIDWVARLKLKKS